MSNDKLFDFLRAKLFASESNSDKWPTPPDHVFENAMVELGAMTTARKKRRRKQATVLIALIFAIGATASLGLYLNKLNQKIESLEVLVSENNDDTMLVRGNTDFISEMTPTKTDARVAANSGSSSDEERFVKNIKHASMSRGISNNTDLESMPMPASVQLEKDNSPAHKVMASDDSTETDHRAYVQMQQLSGMGDVSLDREQEGYSNDIIPHLNLRPAFSEKGSWNLVVSGRANASSLAMSNIPESAPLLTGYDNRYWGSGFEVASEYRLANRWSLSMGVSYSRVSNGSGLVDTHMYDESNEGTDGSGNPMYGADVALESPFGPHYGNLNFYTTGFGLGNGAILDEMVNHRQTLDTWGISVGANYHVVVGPRFELTVGGGVEAMFLSALHSDMEAEVYYEGTLVTEMSDRSDSRQMLNRAGVNAFGRIQGRYFLNEHIGIHAALGYSRSLTSLRNAEGNQPKTYLNQIIPSLGFVLKLNKSDK